MHSCINRTIGHHNPSYLISIIRDFKISVYRLAKLFTQCFQSCLNRFTNFAWIGSARLSHIRLSTAVATGDLGRASELLSRLPKDREFAIYSGNDDSALALMLLPVTPDNLGLFQVIGTCSPFAKIGLMVTIIFMFFVAGK